MTSSQPEVHGCEKFPIYLYFYQGGAGTFLEIFWRLYGEVERERERNTSPNNDAGGYTNMANTILQNRDAFVDRTDPSVFYLTQPRVVLPVG